jgi:hypothetical protein
MLQEWEASGARKDLRLRPLGPREAPHALGKNFLAARDGKESGDLR